MSLRTATSGAAIARTAFLDASSRRTFVTSAKVLAKIPDQTTEKLSPQTSKQASSVLSPSPLSPSAPAAKKHNPVTIAVVKGLARLMGYNSSTTKAIRVSSDLYDRCAERADLQSEFWYKECQLPRTYQVWFQITTLHIYLLLTRFRALSTSKKAQNYSQELINHFFIDAESRMRIRFGVQTARLVKGYMKEMHTQHRGAILSMDEAFAISAGAATDMEKKADADAILATALWRNIWGAGGWGEGVGGVKRKLKGVDRPDVKKTKGGVEPETAEEEGAPELAQDLEIDVTGKSAYAIAAAQHQAESRKKSVAPIEAENLPLSHDMLFAVSLEKLVSYIRRESHRLGNLSDEEIENGFEASSKPSDTADDFEKFKKSKSVASFGDIL